jgi:hypothetical protein
MADLDAARFLLKCMSSWTLDRKTMDRDSRKTYFAGSAAAALREL